MHHISLALSPPFLFQIRDQKEEFLDTNRVKSVRIEKMLDIVECFCAVLRWVLSLVKKEEERDWLRVYEEFSVERIFSQTNCINCKCCFSISSNCCGWGRFNSRCISLCGSQGGNAKFSGSFRTSVQLGHRH